MPDLKVDLKLDRVHCHDPGERSGDEPYLWTIFFKVDGETYILNNDGGNPFLQGFPTVVGTPGNHGNLGASDVKGGTPVFIPAIIGEYHTTMKPIPLTTPLGALTEVGGSLGCVAILMEEDETNADAVQRGHIALDRAVRDEIAALVGTLTITKPDVTDEDIALLTDRVGAAVEDAITEGVSTLSWLTNFGDMDEKLGSAVFRFSHTLLEGSGGQWIPLGRRWTSDDTDDEGDWELVGGLTAAVLPTREDPCCSELRHRVADLESDVQRLQKLEQRRQLREAAVSTTAEATKQPPGSQRRRSTTKAVKTIPQ